jgi:hypothetical protein
MVTCTGEEMGTVNSAGKLMVWENARVKKVAGDSTM